MFLPPVLIPCSHDSLSPTDYLQLAEDIRNMVAYRLRAEHQALRNLDICQVMGHQGQDLLFALGKFRERLHRWCLRDWLQCVEVHHQAFSDGGTKDRFSMAHAPDGSQNLCFQCTL